MEGVKSPFPPASDVPLHRNPPLAPSQELAYRNKCIQLKKRLQEIETNNSQTRARISAEKERIQKQRLLRSILLHQLREIMETPGRRWRPEELERLGIQVNGNADGEEGLHGGRPDGEVLLDDSTDDSDDELPEQRTAPKPGFTPSGYEWMNPGNQSSPNHPHPAAQTVGPVIHHPITTTTRSNSVSQPAQLQVQEREEPASNGYERLINPPSTHSAAQPVRPSPPYLQFCEHMRPQLEADNYPREHLQSRIDEEWRKLSQENRGLWEERYNDQMRDYEDQMDIWKRTQRNANATAMRNIR
ncbi:hypothetical protein LTR64_002257 [Lithohypha guttulata]|uniref:HMG box domain-containing protein n=1 Tax=Lithohypha guttulata TaxID=1690604 RepID=A0AAN7STB5_9EURO|nr:hypothetical protein LTR51_001517 [Lithohypha guttulata]KAK5080935.1 hypothetical protein LTR05_008251 [Lithohypha guttulata]